MKKGFLTMAFFGIISSCFCQEIYYEVKADTGLFENDQYFLSKRIRKIFISMLFIYAGFCFAEPIVYTSTDEVQLLNGNYEPALLLDKNVSVYARNVYGADVGKSPEGELLCRIVYNGINYVADASKFVPKETKCVFDEDIISSALKNEKKALISKNYVDLLFSQDRDSVSKIEPYGYEQYNAYKTEFDYEWFLEVHEFNPSYIFNVVIGLHTIFGYYSFYVLDIEKEADGYKINAVVEKHWDVVVEPTDPQVLGKKQTLTLTVDGDYLTICSDEKTYGTFVIVSETLLSQGTSLLQNNTCDLSKVTWPLHADGTCDYEDAPISKTAEPVEEAAFPESAILNPAPDMGKTAVVIENLRLRADDTATAEIVTTFAIGTRVKVLAPGRKDTIDGIASNWVQVSVLDGAKDKDGNAVEAGTVGWLFGGYLSEAESAERESPNEEASAAKQGSRLPIVPIAAGVAALAVLLAVILLAAKKRKSVKE